MVVWVRRLPVCLLSAFCLSGLHGSGATPYGIDTRVPIGPFLDNKLPSAAPGSGGAWKTVKAFPNLSFDDPVFLTFRPNSNLLYVCGRQGIIYLFVNDSNTRSKTVFLDIRFERIGWNGVTRFFP